MMKLKEIALGGLGFSRLVKKSIISPSTLYCRSNNPDFIIIGAQKSGTSSLFFWLNQHPQIMGSKIKEIHYFNNKKYFGINNEEYKRYFTGKSKLHFEATPAYIYHPGSCENIYSDYPHIKLIAVLRNPVNRAYSAYNHYRSLFLRWRYDEAKKNTKRREGNLLYKKFFQDRNKFPSFRECINIELDIISRSDIYEPGILRRGIYYPQIKKYVDQFGKESLLLLGFKDLIEDVPGTLNRVCDFVGADKIDWRNLKSEPKNQRNYPEKLSDEDREFLEDFYQEPNQQLFNSFGTFNW